MAPATESDATNNGGRGIRRGEQDVCIGHYHLQSATTPNICQLKPPLDLNVRTRNTSSFLRPVRP
jgi:hypothetical protein